MFRVFTSDSPLLGSINVEQYSRPNLTGLHRQDGKAAYDAAILLIASMDLSSKDNYLDWVYGWKKMVAVLSHLSHHLKRPKNYSAVYEDIGRRTLPIISADFNVKMSEYEKLNDLWNERREQFLSWIQSALTLLYKARMTGKLATSQIHALSRMDDDGSVILVRRAA